MTLMPLVVSCPQCGSTDVFYSCKPDCCFNHICNSCYATFELETTRVGEVQEEIQVSPEPESTGPTTPCARRGECRVFAADDAESSAPQLICGDCRALSTLALTNVQPN